MMLEKISVIMSVFNAENYLDSAVESILNQTYSNFEFIIIEDASTDGSLKILEKYQASDDRIILLKNTVNQGAAGFIKNLNIGLKRATGQFIARMDADDISAPDRFEKQVTYLAANPAVFMIGSDVQLIDERGEPLKILSAPSTNADIRKNMFKNISLYHPVLMWRNNKKIFYREKMIGCEDYDLYFRLMNDGYLFGNVNDLLLQYRILNSSISRKSNKLIKWLFVEKSREFFRERQRTGQDSYDNFEPEHFLNIFNPDFRHRADYLLFVAEIALKHNDKKSLKIILKTASVHFPQDKRFRIYHLGAVLPEKLLVLFLKLTRFANMLSDYDRHYPAR